jgi:CDP-diacylglycerol pyrophosphatase
MNRTALLKFSFPLIALAALLVAGISSARAANPNALREIVHNHCVPGQQSGKGPAPCQLVDLAGGYAVLKDIRGSTQYLLLATADVTGIEDPQILEANAPDYWAAAWAARKFVDQLAHQILPREDIGLAINSRQGRTQNQLHIHVDCIRLDVVQKLQAHAAEIGQSWAKLTFLMTGHRYRARRVSGADLTGIYPFRLLADEVPEAAKDMGDQTLVVTGATFSDGSEGFYLLNDQADSTTGDTASGEELLDHDCQVLRH